MFTEIIHWTATDYPEMFLYQIIHVFFKFSFDYYLRDTINLLSFL